MFESTSGLCEVGDPMIINRNYTTVLKSCSVRKYLSFEILCFHYRYINLICIYY